MDTNIPNNLPTGNPSDLTFQVMPKEGTLPTYTPASAAPTSSMPPKAPPLPPQRAPQNLEPALPQDPDSSFLKGKLAYIIIGIVILVVLGALAFFLLGSKKTNEPVAQTPQTKLPKVWMQKYFNKEVCDDQKICGDDADPDSDGLSNYDEFKEGASPINPDTDSDGLADGDEEHIYGTDPTLKYTDRRDIVAEKDWTDSFQIKNGYDPMTPAIKFTDLRKTQIADDTAKYNLHEPSISSLKSTSTDLTTDWKTYSNTQFGFELKYPSSYSLKDRKERNDGMSVESSASCDKILGTGGGLWPKDCFIYNLLIQKNKITGGDSEHVSSIKVSGYSSEKFELKEGMYDNGSQIYIQFEKDGNWYISSLTYNSENKVAAENLLNQILATFKFTK